MLGVNSNVGKMSWRNRSAQYCCVSEEESLDRARPWARQEPCRRDPCLADGCGYQPGAQMSPPNDRVATRPSGSEARKCYTCSKYGHISRDCPQRTTRVTQIKHKGSDPEKEKEVLARAQDSGYDVDMLEMIEECELSPVYDAQDNRMGFLVIIEAELLEVNSRKVAFHISRRKEDVIILGTNALHDLGVEVSIGKKMLISRR
ncbi:zinc knuckle [Cooperia oncophora]